MAKKAKGYVGFINNLPFILKLILALPVLDGIFYGLYRIVKGKLLVGIVWFFLGMVVLWIIDIVCVILHGKVTMYV